MAVELGLWIVGVVIVMISFKEFKMCFMIFYMVLISFILLLQIS